VGASCTEIYLTNKQNTTIQSIWIVVFSNKKLEFTSSLFDD